MMSPDQVLSMSMLLIVSIVVMLIVTSIVVIYRRRIQCNNSSKQDDHVDPEKAMKKEASPTFDCTCIMCDLHKDVINHSRY